MCKIVIVRAFSVDIQQVYEFFQGSDIGNDLKYAPSGACPIAKSSPI